MVKEAGPATLRVMSLRGRTVGRSMPILRALVAYMESTTLAAIKQAQPVVPSVTSFFDFA